MCDTATPSKTCSTRSLVNELCRKRISSNERLSNGQYAGDFALARVIDMLKSRRRNYMLQKLKAMGVQINN